MKTILDMDASELAVAISRQTYTSAEVTEAYIEHLLGMNQGVNCLTQDRFAHAREEAARADERIREGGLPGKLHGVPISVKDSFHVAGMRTTSGLTHRQHASEEQDADVVRQLKREGAIILGKTNTPALCFCQETDNKLHGRTNNPWHPERTAGGSSGGEGACIAAGGAAVGIGADIGGSIRFPSHCNGVIGFKSGRGMISQHGNFPEVTIPEQERMLGIGAMAKSVRDARLINSIIAMQQPAEVDLSAFRILIPGRRRRLPLGKETEAALAMIRQQLSFDFRTEDEWPPYFDGSALIWQQLMSIEGAKHIRTLMSHEGQLHPVKEYVKELVRGDSEVHRYLSWALIGARAFQPSPRRIAEIRELLKRGDDRLTDYFADKIVILPVYHSTAPKHGRLYKELFSVRKTYLSFIPYVAYANVWGLPALTVPVAEDKEGMPIAVQLISRSGNEEALFQLGAMLERQFRGYIRCKKYD